MMLPEAQAVLDAYFGRHPEGQKYRGKAFAEKTAEEGRELARRVLIERGWGADLEPEMVA